jgi:RNA-binding protein
MANTLEVVVTIGKGDITDTVVDSADAALTAHELIKCKVLENSMLSAREACEELSRRCHAEGVQVIGSRFVLYRHSQKLGEKCIQLVQPRQRKTAGKKYEKG